MVPKVGSKWRSSSKIFTVLHTVEINGHRWVHYREDGCPECREFSCYVESFLDRFREYNNQKG